MDATSTAPPIVPRLHARYVTTIGLSRAGHGTHAQKDGMETNAESQKCTHANHASTNSSPLSTISGQEYNATNAFSNAVSPKSRRQTDTPASASPGEGFKQHGCLPTAETTCYTSDIGNTLVMTLEWEPSWPITQQQPHARGLSVDVLGQFSSVDAPRVFHRRDPCLCSASVVDARSHLIDLLLISVKMITLPTRCWGT